MNSFRKATIEDILPLTDLVNSAYRGESSKMGWTTEADLLGGQRTDPDKIKEMIESPDSWIELLLDENQSILGCVFLKNEDPSLYLGMLTVNPFIQSKGMGKELLARAEELGRSLGLRQIRMTVISVRQELIAFYERRGYVRSGKTELFPENDPRFGLPKTKGLIFEEFIKNLVRD